MTRTELVGAPIRSLQTMLRSIAQTIPTVLPVIPDGIYGTDTQESVRSFQQYIGYAPTGVVDLDTWSSISATYQQKLVELRPAEPVRIVLKPGQTILPGEQNSHLPMMHAMMQTLKTQFPSMPAVEPATVHNESSQAATSWLQSKAGLPVTGALDRNTWRHLSRLYSATIHDGAPDVPTNPSAEVS